MKRNAHPASPKAPAKLELRVENDTRLTWVETYREAAREKEDWSDLDATVADGIEPGKRW
jgi:hypothetical protein